MLESCVKAGFLSTPESIKVEESSLRLYNDIVSSDFDFMLLHDFALSKLGKLKTDKVSKEVFEPLRDPPTDLDRDKLGVTVKEFAHARCFFFGWLLGLRNDFWEK